MKKIFIATLLLVPGLAFAQSGEATATTTAATTTAPTCVNLALEKREASLITGHDAFNTAIKAALTNRLNGLKDAWAQTDKKVRQTKRLAAYKAFKTETQTANAGMKTARLNAWKSFETDMKACGIKGHGETPQIISAPTTSL